MRSQAQGSWLLQRALPADLARHPAHPRCRPALPEGKAVQRRGVREKAHRPWLLRHPLHGPRRSSDRLSVDREEPGATRRELAAVATRASGASERYLALAAMAGQAGNPRVAIRRTMGCDGREICRGEATHRSHRHRASGRSHRPDCREELMRASRPMELADYDGPREPPEGEPCRLIELPDRDQWLAPGRAIGVRGGRRSAPFFSPNQSGRAIAPEKFLTMRADEDRKMER